MRFSLLLAALLTFLGNNALASTVCTYRFEGNFSSDQLTVSLHKNGKEYRHACSYAFANDYEGGESVWVYSCSSFQNINVATYLAINVKRNYVWNTYSDGFLFANDLKTLLSTCTFLK